MRKRIVRLKRGFNQQLADQEAEHQRQMRDMEQRLRAEFGRGGSSGVSADEQAHEAKIAALRDKLQKALDDGKATEATTITAEIAREEAKFWNAQTAKVRGEGGEGGQRQSQQRQGASRDTSRGGGPTPKGQRFIEENDWFDDEDYEAERAACLAIERRLLRDGSDPNQPGHYTRLARELKRKFPSLDVTVPRFGVDLEDEDEDGEEEEDGREHRQQRRAPVSRARSGGDAAPPRRSRSTELTEDDKREMRRFHLDPNDNKQVLEWTRNKAASEVAYARSR